MKIIKDSKITIFVVLVVLFIVYMYMKKEDFTSWDPNFICATNDLANNGDLNTDSEPIKTTYIEGEDIIGNYYNESTLKDIQGASV